MGNLLRIIQREDTPLMMPEMDFGNPLMNDMQQTLECIKMLKKESQPICMTHKRIIDQICLYERCRERERFMCSMCQLRSHSNHEEHFVQIQDFKNDLLSYINERRQERNTQLNSLKKPSNKYHSTITPDTTSSQVSNQSPQMSQQAQSSQLSNRATSNSQNSSPNSNFLYDSLLKKFQKTEKLCEQFIFEGIVNDIDSLINQIRQLNKRQFECKQASKDLIEIHQTFSNIIKNFIQRKNLTEAKIFWSQHDLINEIHCGIYSNAQVQEMNPSCNNLYQQQQAQRIFPHRQVLSKKSARGIQTSSSYTTEQIQSSQFSNQIDKKQKQHQPFLSLIKFFEKFEHRINAKLLKQQFSYICQIIYLNSNYCLIPFSSSFSVDSLALYDLQKSEFVKFQKVSLNQNSTTNNYFYQIGFHQFFNENLLQPNNEIFFPYIGYVNETVNQFLTAEHMAHPILFIESPIIQQPEVAFDQFEVSQHNLFHSQTYIEISDDEDQQTNQNDNAQRRSSISNEELQDREEEEEEILIQTPYNISEDEGQQENNEQQNSEKSFNQKKKQNNQNKDQLSNQKICKSSRHSDLDEIQFQNYSKQNKIEEMITIQSLSPKSNNGQNKNKIANFSPIREDSKQQDGYDSELDYFQNIFSSQKNLPESQKNSKRQEQNSLQSETNKSHFFKSKNIQIDEESSSSEQEMINESIKIQDNSNNDILSIEEGGKNRRSCIKIVEENRSSPTRNRKKQTNKKLDEKQIMISDSENSMQEEDKVNFPRKTAKYKPQTKSKPHNKSRNQEKKQTCTKETIFEEEQENNIQIESESEEEIVITNSKKEQKKIVQSPIQIDTDSDDCQNEMNLIRNDNQYNSFYIDEQNNQQNNEYIYQQNAQEQTEFENQQAQGLYLTQIGQIQENEIQTEQDIQFTQEIQEEQNEISYEYHQNYINYEIFETSLDYSEFLNIKPNVAPLLTKVNDYKVIQIDRTNLIFQKINLQPTNDNILKKEMVIKTKNPIKAVISISPLIICVCERKTSLSYLFNSTDSLTFYNIRNKKIIKKINNVGFNGDYVKTLRIGQGNKIICFKSDLNYFIILNWQTGQELKKFKLKDGATFENVRIFIEFYYQMYKDLDFDADKVCMQVGDKILQQSNFCENSLQYCIPYYSQTKSKSYQLGICYLQNKILKSIPFNIKNIQLNQGISQLFISNDQLIIVLKNGEIHHCQVKAFTSQLQSNQTSSAKQTSNTTKS